LVKNTGSRAFVHDSGVEQIAVFVGGEQPIA
jgi:archaellum component FlaG (FlaF/FlaG flagellin family)